MSMNWEDEMQQLWTRAASEVGWGIWRVRDTGDEPVEIPTPHGQPVLVSVPSLNAVVTLDGQVIALTPSSAVAGLLAAVPDLLVPSYRPDGGGVQTGAATPAAAHEKGWVDGFEVGQGEAYDDVNTIVSDLLAKLGQIPDPEVQGAVAAARLDWDATTDDWPNHEGHGDDADMPDAPDPARPVC